MGQTPKWGLPYPEAATLITDSAAIVQELAEKIDTALSAVTASDAYTIPGTLIADMTTSGTFTPPAGVTVVHVVVIGGGGQGALSIGAGGGGGGQVAVYRGVPVSGDVPVVVGGTGTGSSFGAATATAGSAPQAPHYSGIGGNSTRRSNGGNGGVNGYGTGTPGQDGVTVNGTYYAGGGGGTPYGGGPLVAGGLGGGGKGGAAAPGSPPYGTPGTAGLGGGGGGSSYGAQHLGGSGRVMVYTEQPTMRRKAPTPNPDPLIVAALDPDGTMTGAYAVDVAARDLPDIGVRVVDYPLDPVDTGRTTTAPADPDDPDDPTVEVPVMAWPEAGWIWTDTDGWKEPTP